MERSEIPRNTYEGTTLPATGIEGLGTVKVDALREAIREIESQVAERESISKLFEKEGDSMKRSINNFLHESAPKGLDDTEFARERAELRRKSIEINEMQLQEKVNCWRDVVTLKRDLREKEKELFERENRLEAINKILGDE